MVFFAADGMRPDLMETYAAAGIMPTYASLMARGVKGENGLVQAFPPNTGVGWYTLATGTYPGEHGSTNNTFFRTGDSFNNRTAAFSARCPAGRHDRRGGRAGRQEGRLGRMGRRLADGNRAAEARSSTTATSTRTAACWTNWDVPGSPAGANAFGVQYQRFDLADAGGWSQRAGHVSALPRQGTFD